MVKLDSQQQAQMHAIYSHHHGWLYNWLRHRLGCSHQAADLAQDTYLRLIVSERIPNQEQTRPFMLQIAKGLVVDKFRRERLEYAYLEAISHQPETTAASAEEHALAFDALLKIDKMLFGLKPKIRETFLLSRFDGLSYSEIATQLKISSSTVRKYMLIAMRNCIDITAD